MARRKINVSRGTLFIALLIVGVILLLLPQNLTNGLNFLFKEASNLLGASEKAFRRDPITAEVVPLSEYKQLQKQYNNTHALMMKLQEQCEKLAQLRIALPKPGPAIMPVNVIDVTIGSFGHELFVNKGSRDHLETGQYVMSINGNSIIGTVFETTETRAKIRLITDAKHRIEIRIWREGKTEYIPGQMRGDGKSACKIPLIRNEYDVREGDTVYAADRAGFLEIPIIVGEISEVKPDETKPLLWDITVKPVEDLSAIAEVAVIVARPLNENDK